MTLSFARSGWRSQLWLPALAGGVALCMTLDVGLVRWLQVGPPAGKGGIFFLELVLLLAGSLVVVAAAVAAPERLRTLLPAGFVLLAWHTGFQVSLSTGDILVLSVFDVLVPIVVLLALAGRWYDAVLPGYARLLRVFALFWVFCLWGVALAVTREVDPIPLLANLKSFLVYPLIALLIPLCIQSWRQLYVTTGLLLALVFERALEGIGEGASSATKTLLANGQVVARIDGHMDSVNQYACYLMIGFLVLLAIIVSTRSNRIRLGLAVPTLLTLVALLLTFSRGAWLATLIGLVVLAWSLGARRAVGAGAAVLAGVALLLTIQPAAVTLVAARVGRYDNSIQERQQFLSLGVEVLSRYPAGAGWGAGFAEAPAGVQPVDQAPWYHDDYLQLATEIGLPGLAVFLALWAVILRRVKQASSRLKGTQRGLCIGLLAAACGVLVQATTEQMFWRANIAPQLWIVAGLALAAANLAQHRETGRSA